MCGVRDGSARERSCSSPGQEDAERSRCRPAEGCVRGEAAAITLCLSPEFPRAAAMLQSLLRARVRCCEPAGTMDQRLGLAKWSLDILLCPSEHGHAAAGRGRSCSTQITDKTAAVLFLRRGHRAGPAALEPSPAPSLILGAPSADKQPR